MSIRFLGQLLTLFVLATAIQAQKPCDIYTEDYECPENKVAASKRDFEGRFKCSEYPMEATLELLEEGEKQIELSENDEAVMVIGRTGTGKSTFTYFIAGDNSQMISYKKATGTYLIKDCNGKISSGGTIVSATIFPDLVIEAESNTAFYDNPGFQDTRDVCTEIANAYFIQIVARHVQRLKIILVVDSASIKPGGDRLTFPEMLKSVINFLPNIEKFGKGLALVGTKLKFDAGEEVEDPYIEDAVAFLQDNRNDLSTVFPDPDQLRKARFIVDTLIDSARSGHGRDVSSSRIAIFRAPTDCGLLSDLEHMQANKRNISQVIMNNIQFVESSVQDFGYSLSDTAKLTIAGMAKKLVDDNALLLGTFSQELYHYIEFQLNCIAVRECDQIVGDIKILFSNPDFLDHFNNTALWSTLAYTAVIERLTNRAFLPPKFSVSQGTLETLEKNAGYLDFLSNVTTLNNQVDLLLDPLRKVLTDMKRQVEKLVSDLSSTSTSILSDLSQDFKNVSEQDLSLVLEGKLADTATFERALTNLYRASYNLSSQDSLAGFKPSEHIREIIDNVLSFKEGFSRDIDLDRELSALSNFSFNLDGLSPLDNGVDLSFKLDPSSWSGPLIRLNNTVFKSVDGNITIVYDSITTFISQLHSLVEDHYSKLSRPDTEEMFKIVDVARRQFDLINSFRTEFDQSQGRDNQVFLGNLTKTYDSVNVIFIILGSQSFVKDIEVKRRTLGVLERMNLGKFGPIEGDWILLIRDHTTEVLKQIIKYTKDHVDNYVLKGANETGSKLTSAVTSTYKDQESYPFQKQLDLMADEGSLKSLLTQLNGCSTLKCFSFKDWALLTKLVAKIGASDLQKLPGQSLSVDFEDLGESPYSLKNWIAHYQAALDVVTAVKGILLKERPELNSPRITNWGSWGSWDRCPTGTYVSGMQLQVEDYQYLKGPSDDDTSLNSIKFFCSPWTSSTTTKSITSSLGPFGRWRQEIYCPGTQKAIGFQLRSEGSQGPGSDDDTAANNLILYCDGGDQKEGDGNGWGGYTQKQTCGTGKVLCGIKTQIEGRQGSDDDTALNNLDAECCNIVI